MKRRDVLTRFGTAPLTPLLAVQNSAPGVTPSNAPEASYFPNVVLSTHENKQVRFYDDLIRNKIVVINFMYATCEGICPGMTANLLRVQKILGDRIGRDIFMYSLTLDPEHDTPGVLKHYVEMHRVRPGWLFLTGKRDEMDSLRRKLGFVDPNPVVDRDKSQHIGVIRYGNEALNRWAACPALLNPKQIVQSILWMEGPISRT